MELSQAVRAFEWLLGLSLVLQSLEYLRLPGLDRVNDWALLRQEIPSHPRWVRPLLDRLLAPRAYRVLLLLRLALALLLFGSWQIVTLVDFTRSIFQRIPTLFS